MSEKNNKPPHQNPLVNRLHRIEGQVRGISKMVLEKREYEDVLIQVKAIKSALSSLEMKLIEFHLEKKLKEVQSSKKQEDITLALNEMTKILKNFI